MVGVYSTRIEVKSAMKKVTGFVVSSCTLIVEPITKEKYCSSLFVRSAWT